jgi:large subunit ribosomal protein LP1
LHFSFCRVYNVLWGWNTQSEKIIALTSAAGIELESIWASLLAKALEGKNVKELLSNIGAGGAGPAAGAPVAAGGAAAAAAGDAPAAEEKKKEEEKEESDDDMVSIQFSLPGSYVTDTLCRALVSSIKSVFSSDFVSFRYVIVSFASAAAALHAPGLYGGPALHLRIPPCIHYTLVARTKRLWKQHYVSAGDGRKSAPHVSWSWMLMY